MPPGRAGMDMLDGDAHKGESREHFPAVEEGCGKMFPFFALLWSYKDADIGKRRIRADGEESAG